MTFKSILGQLSDVDIKLMGDATKKKKSTPWMSKKDQTKNDIFFDLEQTSTS